jgi:hypothetical protein
MLKEIISMLGLIIINKRNLHTSSFCLKSHQTIRGIFRTFQNILFDVNQSLTNEIKCSKYPIKILLKIQD